MKTNLRSLVAQAHRVGQGRTFSSSAPNPIDDKGKGSLITPLLDFGNRYALWFVAGYVFHVGWEISALFESKAKMDEFDDAYRRELKLHFEEMRLRGRSIRGFSEE